MADFFKTLFGSSNDRKVKAMLSRVGKINALEPQIKALSDEQLRAFKDKLIDTSVKGIIKALDLAKPIYAKTSAYGHFGKPDLPWEKISSI